MFVVFVRVCVPGIWGLIHSLAVPRDVWFDDCTGGVHLSAYWQKPALIEGGG